MDGNSEIVIKMYGNQILRKKTYVLWFSSYDQLCHHKWVYIYLTKSW